MSAWMLAPLRHRGYWHICRWLGRFVDDREVCRILLEYDAIFKIKLSDPYWNRLIGQSFDYEPEIAAVLKLLKELDYTFIDCGANHGYWSVLVTSAVFGCKRVVAIEPYADTFRMLEDNNRLNGGRFITVRRAVADTTDTEVVIRYRGSHSGVRIVSESVVTDNRPARDEKVQTISVDDVFQEYVHNKDKPIVVKLDVEGSEIPALTGAKRVLSHDPLVIYEDHGRDPECVVSRFVSNQLNMEIFFANDSGSITEMNTVDEIRSVKVQGSRGYNFIAVNRHSMFHELLKSWERSA